jgi:hypothetical protein
MLQLSQQFLDHIASDEHKVFNTIKKSVPVSEFVVKELDAGEKQPAKVIKVFDNQEDKKWELAFRVLDSYCTFQKEADGRDDKDFSAIVIVPASKFSSFGPMVIQNLTFRHC